MSNSREEFEKNRKLYKLQLKDECYNCGNKNLELYIHHIVPLALGGTNRITNLSNLCGTCHSTVHDIKSLMNIRNLSKKGRDTKKEAGLWPGGKVPFGYTNDTTKKEKGHITISKEQADIVNYIFDSRFIKLMSITQIQDVLKLMAIPTVANGAWSLSTITRVLEADVYFGGEHLGVPFPQILDTEYKILRENFLKQYSIKGIYKKTSFKSKCKLIYPSDNSKVVPKTKKQPYGFRNLSHGKIGINQKEAIVIKKIFSLRKSGMSVSRIEEVLKNEKILFRKKKPFAVHYIYKILNEKDVYCESYAFGLPSIIEPELVGTSH